MTDAPTITPDDITKASTDDTATSSPSGWYSYFVSLGNGWGIKVFHTEKSARLSYDRQSVAAEFNVGPEVGEFMYLGNDKWGYVSEEVEVGPNDKKADRTEQELKNFRDARYAWELLMDDWKDEQRQIKAILAEYADFPLFDAHPWNWGFKNERNTLVCIDFATQTEDFQSVDEKRSYIEDHS